MTVCHPVPLVFSREHIEAGLVATHARWLHGAARSRASALRHRQRLVLGFTGFNGAGDPLFEQPTVRQWMRDLDRHWPFWFFFLDPHTPVAVPADAPALPAGAHRARAASCTTPTTSTSSGPTSPP